MIKLLLIAFVSVFFSPGLVAQVNGALSAEALQTLYQKSKSDTNRAGIAIQLSQYYLDASSKGKMDTALFYAKRAVDLSVAAGSSFYTGSSYLQLARVMRGKLDTAAAVGFVQKAMVIFTKNGPPDLLADAYIESANNRGEYDAELQERVLLYEKAIAVLTADVYRKKKADLIKGLANILLQQGKLNEGLEKLHVCLGIYQSLKYPAIQEVYSLIGVVYTQLGNYEEAIRYGLQAAKTVEALKDSTIEAALIYDYLAVTYEKLGQVADADIYLKKALFIAERKPDRDLIFMLSGNISHISLRAGKAAEALDFLKGITNRYGEPEDLFISLQITAQFMTAYLHLQDYKNAGRYCSKLLSIAKGISPDNMGQTMVYPLVTRYYLETNQYQQARYYLDLYKDISEKNNVLDMMKEMHFLYYRLDSALGKYPSAIAHYKIFKSFTDSMFNQAKSKEIERLQIQYGTEKKDQDIRHLTEQALLQKVELREERILKNVTFGGIALLLIIVGLLYNRYRLKQRTNKKLESQQFEINKKNNSLEHLLHEKEWLLKEIHHRVKNNLQIVMSLLNSQFVYLDNDAALAAIQNSQHRVQAMSLIHQKLYNSDNVSSIGMPAYIGDLVSYLKDCFGTGQQVQFELDIAPLELDVSQAVPLGLILNEAITNSLKYAFPENGEGMIQITLAHQAGNHYLLRIADNGTGMPQGVDVARPGSLGMTLMQGLSEDLDGNFTVENNNGTVISISFVYDPGVKRMGSFTFSSVYNN